MKETKITGTHHLPITCKNLHATITNSPKVDKTPIQQNPNKPLIYLKFPHSLTCLFVSGARARFLIAFHFLRAHRPTCKGKTIIFNNQPAFKGKTIIMLLMMMIMKCSPEAGSQWQDAEARSLSCRPAPPNEERNRTWSKFSILFI